MARFLDRCLLCLFDQSEALPLELPEIQTLLAAAVAQAYGWTDYTPAMPDEEILRRVLALNLERAGR